MFQVLIVSTWSGLLLTGSVIGVLLWRAHERIYRYAVMMADRFDVDDPRGQAYSDMATVIALDGKASPKAWAGRGGSMSTDGEGRK